LFLIIAVHFTIVMALLLVVPIQSIVLIRVTQVEYMGF